MALQRGSRPERKKRLGRQVEASSASVARMRSAWMSPVTGVSIEQSITWSLSLSRCQGRRASTGAARTKVPRPTSPVMTSSRVSSS